MENEREAGAGRGRIKPAVWQAALAGLLHDIGKFAQRAGRAIDETWDAEARDTIKYEHALASYGFVHQFIPPPWRSGLSGVAYHHQPKNLADRWVQLADWMSSAEREEDEAAQPPSLQTVFSRVRDFEQPSYWPLARLAFTSKQALFPRPAQPVEPLQARRDKYAELWTEFEDECRRRGLTTTTTLSPTAFLENLLSLLQEFTWSIPSAYWKSVPDVSLFDHLRTTAALAACLAGDERDQDWCESVYRDLSDNRESRPAALLVAGDFSGVQDFIYTLSSSGAAKSLRARSFYLQLLGEVVLTAMLDALGLPASSVLYSGGGVFYLLAPTSAEAELPGLARWAIDRLVEAHRGSLGLVIAWETVRADEFARFNRVYDRLGQRLSQAKRRPFAQASLEQLAQQIGVPLTSGGDPLKFCRVTGDDWDVQEDKRGDYKTRFVQSLEELGAQLPRATEVVLYPSPSASIGRPHTWREALQLFGLDAEIVTANTPVGFLKAKGLARVLRLDPRGAPLEEQLLGQLRTRAEVILLNRPMAKLVPRGRDGSLLTFDDLAAEQASGIKRWGVLRMDVDNLGKLFREGLGEKASLSRVANLSSSLRLFFEGWLPQLARDDLRDKLYIQYSGGDDVFVVGAWDALPEFAQRVRDSFREFTGGNPAFTLSGGIAVVDAKFPLYQAARLAGQAEAASKSFKEDGMEKDAITFLGHTSDWRSFAQVKKNALRLAEWCRSDGVPAALLQVIIGLRQQITAAHAAARRAGKPHRLVYGRWMWMAAYQLTRMKKDAKGDAREGIDEIQESFLKPGAESEQWGLAARWAQYLVRGGE